MCVYISYEYGIRFPSNAKYTKELYLEGSINEHEASKILMFTHFSNPLFLLGTLFIFVFK